MGRGTQILDWLAMLITPRLDSSNHNPYSGHENDFAKSSVRDQGLESPYYLSFAANKYVLICA
jgi:hypothetical protein